MSMTTTCSITIQAHAVVQIRSFVVEGAAFDREVRDGIVTTGDVEGLAHAQMGELRGDVLMAFRAAGIIDVAVGDQWGRSSLGWKFSLRESSWSCVGSGHEQQCECRSQDGKS